MLTGALMVIPDTDRADDDAFDAVYPACIRLLSGRFWTPVAVARRAADLLYHAGAHRVLDVGAGSGKFVLAAASAAPRLDFVGVEQRPHLVEAARRACLQLGVSNAHFQVADVTSMSWEGFDAFYFFNPLAENLFVQCEQIDDRVELTEKRFAREVLRIERALRKARLGTVVVTYHGSSVRMPTCHDLRASEPAGTDWLRLWTKRREADDGSFFVEVDDGLVWRSQGTSDGLAS